MEKRYLEQNLKKKYKNKAVELLNGDNLSEIIEFLNDLSLLEYYPKEVKNLTQKWADIHINSEDYKKSFRERSLEKRDKQIRSIYFLNKQINKFKEYIVAFDTGGIGYTRLIYAQTEEEAWRKVYNYIAEFYYRVQNVICIEVDGKPTSSLQNIYGSWFKETKNGLCHADIPIPNWRNPYHEMKLIVATNNLNQIGLNGEMLWHNKEDLKHFKALTLGKKLMVGRTTFEKLPPLKDREIIVVGTGYHTLEEALNKEPDWVIGGAKLYNSTIHLCSEIHISKIDNDLMGDTEFKIPEWYKGKVFEYKF